MSALSAQRDGEILRLTYSRPTVANAFGVTEAKELTRLLKTEAQARILIWQAVGSRCFSAGGDLAFYARQPKRTQGLVANRQITQALHALTNFGGVSLAVVDGDCWGGGLELLSCFDWVWATPRSGFGLWQRRIGLSFGWGGGARLHRRLGPVRLRQLALSTQALSALGAEEWGLVDRVIPAQLMESRVKEWAKAQIDLPREPVSALKTLKDSNESKWFEKLWWNDHHRRVLKRFKENSR